MTASMAERKRAVLDALDDGPLTADEIAARTGLSHREVVSVLQRLNGTRVRIKTRKIRTSRACVPSKWVRLRRPEPPEPFEPLRLRPARPACR